MYRKRVRYNTGLPASSLVEVRGNFGAWSLDMIPGTSLPVQLVARCLQCSLTDRRQDHLHGEAFDQRSYDDSEVDRQEETCRVNLRFLCTIASDRDFEPEKTPSGRDQ